MTDVPAGGPEELFVKLQLWDHDTLKSNDLIGEVVLTDDVVQFEWNEDAKAKWAGSNNDMDTTSEPTLNEKAIRIRLWMPLDNGGGSAMYKLTDTVVPVPSKHVLFRITDDTEAQLFKRRRMKVPVQCTNGHAMEQNKANPDDKECDNVPLGLCSTWDEPG